MPSKLVIFCYDFAWASSLMRVLQTLGYNIIMPTSNGYILFILNPNLVKFVSNVKSQMYTCIFYFFLGIKHIYAFQWNKFHSKINHGVKHINKIYELSLISSSLSIFWPTFNHNTISINPNLKCFSAKICQHIYQS